VLVNNFTAGGGANIAYSGNGGQQVQVPGSSGNTLKIYARLTPDTTHWQLGNMDTVPAQPAACAQNGNCVVSTITIGGDLSAANMARGFMTFDTGNLTALPGATVLFDCQKPGKGGTIENGVVTAGLFTCAGNPTLKIQDCGATVNACGSPTTLVSTTPTAAGAADATITNATLTAGDYICMQITAGTCTALDLTVKLEHRIN